ncbi:D-2-hydroxyacid dehydrogenase [Liquorilactobacillus satsumensis]|uniref:D-lactate dehydrogenase n=1 Tax=Liquorilactobacillus satsumensis DSM 16230 = JCM 12392 TaxID=1423801 RepID=A0A0R1V3H3_9LACO|nr:D-2-hydroxyacid dehydrogenase [Liquorilactobacillus satsumensis]KRM00071.1 D-lactate dehydrogenase [Liquorilactobacillus satsumensis DSM 16230 = JCM 12392]MCP9329586.1 D-2-hydroxyacid dehydrogenase [Liquorilactobacillus satsumensis]
MTKILMLSVRDDEKAAIKAWEKRNQIAVTTVPWELHPETASKVAGFDGLVVQQRSKIEAEVYPLLKAAGLKQVTTRTAGYDMVDVKAAVANGLVVTNVPAYSPRSVAELALAHTMRLIRNLEIFDKRMEKQDFRWVGLQAAEIHSLTIGIIGAGRIGATSAQIFNALGANVIAYDVQEREELKSILTYKRKEEVLAQADVICLHVDLNPTSVKLIDEKALSLMKPTAFLVNECRGPVVDTEALITALEHKQLAGAALDTLTGEENFFNFNLEGKKLPSQQLERLRSFDNVILTPHVGFYTNIAVKNMVDISLDDVVTILHGGRSEHQVS